MKKPETTYAKWYRQTYPGLHRWRHDDRASMYNAQYEIFLLEEKLSHINAHLKRNPKDMWARVHKVAKANDLAAEIQARKAIMVLEHGRESLDKPKTIVVPKGYTWDAFTNGYERAKP